MCMLVYSCFASVKLVHCAVIRTHSQEFMWVYVRQPLGSDTLQGHQDICNDFMVSTRSS